MAFTLLFVCIRVAWNTPLFTSSLLFFLVCLSVCLLYVSLFGCLPVTRPTRLPIVSGILSVRRHFRLFTHNYAVYLENKRVRCKVKLRIRHVARWAKKSSFYKFQRVFVCECLIINIRKSQVVVMSHKTKRPKNHQRTIKSCTALCSLIYPKESLSFCKRVHAPSWCSLVCALFLWYYVVHKSGILIALWRI